MKRLGVAIAFATALAAGVMAVRSEAASENGLIAYTHVTYPWDSDVRLPVVMAIKPDGTGSRVLLPPDERYAGGTSTPRWSRDGRRLLFARFLKPRRFSMPNERFVRALWHSTASGAELSRIPLGLGRVQLHGYDWAPDRRRIVFAAQRAGDPARRSWLYTIAPDGSRLRALRQEGWSPSWSGDGRYIVFVDTRNVAPDSRRIALVMPDGTGFKWLTAAAGSRVHYDQSPSFSPGGRKVVYVRRIESTEAFGGREEWRIVSVYGRRDAVVRTLDASTRFWYGPPQWRPDGKRLAVTRRAPAPNDTQTATMVTVDLDTGRERVAFRFPYVPAIGSHDFSWQATP